MYANFEIEYLKMKISSLKEVLLKILPSNKDRNILHKFLAYDRNKAIAESSQSHRNSINRHSLTERAIRYSFDRKSCKEVEMRKMKRRQ